MPHYRIDIHHHIVPKFYVGTLKEIGITTCFGLAFPDWSPEKAINVLNKNKIATAITSISTPGVYFKNSAFSSELASQCNEYSAELIRKYPGTVWCFCIAATSRCGRFIK